MLFRTLCFIYDYDEYAFREHERMDKFWNSIDMSTGD